MEQFCSVTLHFLLFPDEYVIGCVLSDLNLKTGSGDNKGKSSNESSSRFFRLCTQPLKLQFVVGLYWVFCHQQINHIYNPTSNGILIFSSPTIVSDFLGIVHLILVIARQRSCWKVMFSAVSVYLSTSGSPPSTFKIVHLGLHCTMITTSDMRKRLHYLARTVGKVGSWHSTGMPYIFECVHFICPSPFLGPPHNHLATLLSVHLNLKSIEIIVCGIYSSFCPQVLPFSIQMNMNSTNQKNGKRWFSPYSLTHLMNICEIQNSNITTKEMTPTSILNRHKIARKQKRRLSLNTLIRKGKLHHTGGCSRHTQITPSDRIPTSLIKF